MNLPSELYSQIASSLGTAGDEITPAGTPAGQSDDARTAPRVRAARHIAAQHWDDLADLGSARIRDLSPGGLCILLAERLPLDHQLLVRLPTGSGAEALVLCSVVYWEPLSLNLCAVGLQFQEQITGQQLADQQANLDELATLDQRPATPGVLARITQAFSRRVAG